jgi:hypothetical protein
MTQPKLWPLYETTNENRVLKIERTDRADAPFLLTLTVKKLGVTTSVYYFLSAREAKDIAKAVGE